MELNRYNMITEYYVQMDIDTLCSLLIALYINEPIIYGHKIEIPDEPVVDVKVTVRTEIEHALIKVCSENNYTISGLLYYIIHYSISNMMTVLTIAGECGIYSACRKED